MLQKVLIANRGEIAVPAPRACKDAGIGGIAVLAEPDRDAQFVRLVDEAPALGGTTPAETYLDIARNFKVAADLVHPGYAFLGENAEFAQAVLDAHLIRPVPGGHRRPRRQGPGQATRAEGQRSARSRPQGRGHGRRGIVEFANEHGLSVAIKALFGGGVGGPKKPKRSAKKAGASASADSATSRIQGTILKVAVEDGHTVAVGKLVVVLEVMKMEQPRKAYKAASVTGPQAEAGAIVANGVVICQLKDCQ